MSKSYREQCNDAKAVRRGIEEHRPVRIRSKKENLPYEVEYRYNWPEFIRDSGWRRWRRYRTKKEAEKVIEMQNRKHPGLWEFRLKGESK